MELFFLLLMFIPFFIILMLLNKLWIFLDLGIKYFKRELKE